MPLTKLHRAANKGQYSAITFISSTLVTAIKIPVYSDWGQKTAQIGGGLGLVMEQQQLAVSCHTNYADHSTLTSPGSRGGYILTIPELKFKVKDIFNFSF